MTRRRQRSVCLSQRKFGHIVVGGRRLLVSVLSSESHQVSAHKVACFTHAMRLDGVGKLIPNDRRRPHRAGVKKGGHPLKMRGRA